MMAPLQRMQILQDRERGAVIVAPAGRLDSLRAPTLRDALAALDTAGERRIVLDLAGVDYVSSAGLAVLFELAKRMHANGGVMALCALHVHVRRVIELAGYMHHFTITTTREEAVAHVTS